MKKRIATILLVALLLTGCSAPIEGPDAPTNPPTVTQPTTPAPTRPRSDLLDRAEPIGGQSQLRYIPGSYAEEFYAPQLFGLQDAVLLSHVTYDGNGELATHQLVSFTLATGKPQGRYCVENAGSVEVKTQSGCVAILDHERKKLDILDARLNLLESYRVDTQWGDWYLSQDLQRLYYADWEAGITVTELATGQARLAIAQSVQGSILDAQDDRLLVEYVDTTTQRSCMAFLDMSTGATETVHLSVNGAWTTCAAGEFLLQDHGNYQTYHLKGPEFHSLVTIHQGGLTQLDPTGHLLWNNGSSLALYDSQGKFLSAVTLPQQQIAYSYEGFYWWEDFGGYLFVAQGEQGNAKLYFWDLSQSCQGEDLPLRAYDDAVPGGYAADPALYRRAQELGQKYGLDIRIADQCGLDYDEYYSYAVTDYQAISDSLDTLEKALASYPQDYFRQLLYGKLESIRVEMIAGLAKKDLAADAAYTSFSAFAQNMGNYYLVVADVYSSYEETWYHEFSHITDGRLEWDAQLRPEALYSSDGWLALQPKGFQFSYSYDILPEDVGSSRYDGWFVDDYACTFPTEDRARTMEHAMVGWDWTFESEHIRAKLDYYSRCIRDCFDTTAWPEVTAWEKPLT